MIKRLKFVSTLSVLAMSLFLWSCDNVGDTMQPELKPAKMVVMSTSGNTYTVAMENDPEVGTVTAVIGSSGGHLILGQHTLDVSANAVDQPTTFTMTRSAENPLRVKLTAGRESENDVGSVGFAAPVSLTLSYVKAEDAPADKSLITLFYFRPDGLVEEMTTNLRVSGADATADLPHFSLFGLGWP